jgi:hypothetical protein
MALCEEHVHVTESGSYICVQLVLPTHSRDETPWTRSDGSRHGGGYKGCGGSVQVARFGGRSAEKMRDNVEDGIKSVEKLTRKYPCGINKLKIK